MRDLQCIQPVACQKRCLYLVLQWLSVQVKLEYYIRECLEPKERPEQTLFPPGSGPAGNWK